MKTQTTRLLRIHPELLPVDRKKKIGKAFLWHMLPTPFGEIGFGIKYLMHKFGKNGNEEDWITIDGYKLIAGGKSNDLSQSFLLEEVNDLKVYFTNQTIMDADEDIDERHYKNQLSRITFSHQHTEYELFYEARKKTVLKMIKHLYASGVKFKEYFNQRRVYLFKKPKYKEIQEIKDKYGIEW